MKRWILFSLCLFLVASCTGTKRTANPNPPAPPRVYIPSPPPEIPKEGSLYTSRGVFLFEDHRARRIGDVITVKIVENYRSSTSVDNKLERKSGIKAGIAAFLGIEKHIEEKHPNFQADNMFESDWSSKTEGKGKQSRNTNIVATITARVIDVLPNGNLVIQGVRTVRQNENLEYLTVTGIVRPEDISPDNSVYSTQIADAHIEYSGAGPTTQVVRGPGWLSRILQLIWLF